MLAAMKARADKPFDVTCPDCGAILKVDPETRAILSHTPAPRKRTFEDFEAAAKAMRAQVDKRFEEALRKAKETPDEGRPLREFDLD
jgi:hypothetical protein